jgi:hypothetical protein
MVSDERSTEQQENERVPWQQMIFDDIFLLVTAGLVVPTVFYLVWGLWSISNVEFFGR